MGILEKELLVLMEKFFVRGRPVPQGSMKFIRPGVMIHSRAKELAVWRADIARNAELYGYKPVSGAIAVEINFVFNKPKTVTRELPTVAPDLDKLVRAVLDGLTGVAYEDDCQVVTITASKHYGGTAGAWIGVARL
jgi:crossover junction endodeoxyribonuclease RusA